MRRPELSILGVTVTGVGEAHLAPGMKNINELLVFGGQSADVYPGGARRSPRSRRPSFSTRPSSRPAWKVAGNVVTPGDDLWSYYGNNTAAEWNVFVDAAAADMVLAAAIDLVLVPLDATNEVPVTTDFVDAYTKAAGSDPYASFVAQILQEQAGETDFFDPLAAAVLITEVGPGLVGVVACRPCRRRGRLTWPSSATSSSSCYRRRARVPGPDDSLRHRSIRTLAWLGDAEFEREVRLRLSRRGDYPTDRLDKLRARIVNAEAQAGLLAELTAAEVLREDELAVVGRARNTSVRAGRKGARGDVRSYRAATALEALIAWWLIAGEHERFRELVAPAIEARIDELLAGRP